MAPLILRSDRRDQVLAAGIEYRAGGARRIRVRKFQQIAAAGATEVFGVCSQAAFFRRSALEAVGGWTAEVGPDLADVELAWAFRRAGYRTVLEPAACIYAQSLPAARLGAFRQGLYSERLFWRNAGQVGWLKALAAHAWPGRLGHLLHLPHPGGVLLRPGGAVCAAADFRHDVRDAGHRADTLTAEDDCRSVAGSRTPCGSTPTILSGRPPAADDRPSGCAPPKE